jgi:hypothetical protein
VRALQQRNGRRKDERLRVMSLVRETIAGGRRAFRTEEIRGA